ncbi:helix-turn-helix domain-containing protein [Streptomyces zingiberis]|uniref:Helix-turn-helix domain-containing protein n=1 Tax=Streptomyces zingiberis TaxID=2053010 RepID=A0ABX1BZQ2_9ACTN|nr:helix-turn-helix transcriptional regulator [Streptomyces zingiberis]NJQ00139.1 helix-turn-helix domain-containing protein [Streptomyces zingiberis]
MERPETPETSEAWQGPVPGAALRDGAARGVAEAGSLGDGRSGQDPGTGLVVAFGRQLKLLRTRAGLERPECGARLSYAPSTIASFEQGRRVPPGKFIERADEVLDAGGLLTALKDEMERAQYPAFFRDAARLEAEALELWLYAVYAVPGLLQTEAYTRALLAMRRPLLDEETIERRVTARATRQKILSRWPAPLMSFVIDESVLRRPFGGKHVLRGALERMHHLGEMRNVEIQVMPLDREDNAGVDGPFTVITRRGGSQVAYLEAQGRSTLLTDGEEVRAVAARYGIIRSQALSPQESRKHIERLLGEA